ncbi:hypothetical protein T484DRAFT_1758571, partial [Baffinella frigidus]
MNAVQAYSSEVALGEGVVQILPRAAAEEFVKGDLPWPPTYVYWGSDDTCNIVTSALAAVQKAIALVSLAYDKDRAPTRPPVLYNPLKLFATMWKNATQDAQDKKVLQQQERTAAYGQHDSQPVATFDEYLNNSAWYIKLPAGIVRATGLDPAPVIGLVYKLPDVVVKLVRCNVHATFFCSEHHYSVFTSAFIALILLTVLGFVSSMAGVPLVGTLLSILGFLGIVMFISFEYAPACAPLIPTCFFASMVADVAYFLPVKILIPQSLLQCRHDQSESVPDASCVVECSAAPFHFDDFSANLAWLVCHNSLSTCAQMERFLETSGNWYSVV